VDAVDRQVGPQREIATLFSVSRTFIKKLLRQRRETGSVAPKPHGGGHSPKLDDSQRAVVRAYILKEQNDATLEEVQAYVARRLKVYVSQATVSRVLRWLDLSRKKTLVASERNEAKRAAFRAQVAPLGIERLLFVDEASTHTAMTRRYARAPRGERAYGRVPRNHGQNLSVIGALGLRGMTATMSVEGAVDTEVFNVFVTQILVPTLQPGDVVLLDNLKVHQVSNIEQAVNAAGAEVIFLPAYSPDFSPIEPCWSKLKTFLRGCAARTHALLGEALTKALRTLQPADIRGWFRHCGYEVASE